MKKFILSFVLIPLSIMRTSAQQELPNIAASNYTILKSTALADINTFKKDIYLSVNNDSLKDYNYYMQKSKNNRTAGWILLGGGLVLSGVGLLISTSSSASFDNTESGVLVMGIGAVAGIVSIPFMIMAHANKNKARLLLSTQKTAHGIPANADKKITGITLLMPLGR